MDSVRVAVLQMVSGDDLDHNLTQAEALLRRAAAEGAELVLLIVAALDDAELAGFLQLTESLGMHALVEAHTPEEIEEAVKVSRA